MGHLRHGVWTDVKFPQGHGPHLRIEAVAGRSDNVWRKSAEEEVGGGDMAESEDDKAC